MRISIRPGPADVASSSSQDVTDDLKHRRCHEYLRSLQGLDARVAPVGFPLFLARPTSARRSSDPDRSCGSRAIVAHRCSDLRALPKTAQPRSPRAPPPLEYAQK